MEDGLMERFLFAYPNVRTIRHSWYEISEESTQEYTKLYHRLLGLRAGQEGENFSPKPLHMTLDAKRLFGKLLHETSAEAMQPGFPVRLEAAWSKMRGYLARISLILAVCRFVSTDADTEQVELEDVQNAHTLLEYFKAHSRRVYGVIQSASPTEVFAGHLRGFLLNNDRNWKGSPTVLLEALGEAEVPDLPEIPTEITKLVKAVAAHSPGLELQQSRTKKGRNIMLQLVTDLPDPEDPTDLDPAKHLPQKPDAPVTLSPPETKTGSKADKTAPAESQSGTSEG